MERYFNINYEFNKKEIKRKIDELLANDGHGYIPVADGVVLNTAQRNIEYLKVLNESMFAICDSSWVPLYIKWIYGYKREQYCGSMIFPDYVKMKKSDGSSKYQMAFLGTNSTILNGLRRNIANTMNKDVMNMLFYELPFCSVDEFDYRAIAEMLNKKGVDIIWVALGAPKQEIFMNRLNKHLNRGVQIAVGAVFKFFSGYDEKRAPEWITRNHLEFLYRIYQDPKKQIKRCSWILATLPKMYFEEVQRKHKADKSLYALYNEI